MTHTILTYDAAEVRRGLRFGTDETVFVDGRLVPVYDFRRAPSDDEPYLPIDAVGRAVATREIGAQERGRRS